MYNTYLNYKLLIIYHVSEAYSKNTEICLVKLILDLSPNVYLYFMLFFLKCCLCVIEYNIQDVVSFSVFLIIVTEQVIHCIVFVHNNGMF